MGLRLGNKILIGKGKDSEVTISNDDSVSLKKTQAGNPEKTQAPNKEKLEPCKPVYIEYPNVVKTIPLFLYAHPGFKDTFLYDREELQIWDKDKLIDEDGDYLPLHFPFVIDTEFYTDKSKLTQQSRNQLTTQIKGIGQDAPKMIFVALGVADEVNESQIKAGLSPFPIIQSEAHFVDYLVSCGIDAKINPASPEKVKKLPEFYMTQYSHFATAEILMIFDGSMRDEVLNFIENEQIESRRRVYAKTEFKSKKSVFTSDWVEFQNHSINIDGIEYAIRWRIIDTCAIHGVAGYGDIAKNVGWKLEHKDNFTKKEKGEMLRMAVERPQEFNDYALGDLDVYEILQAYDTKWRQVYEILGLSTPEQEYYQPPKLTIGGTVKDLFLAKLAGKLGITDDFDVETLKVKSKWQKVLKERVTDKYLEFNPGNLREFYRSTKCLLTKVEGGRCRNNRPTDVHVRRKIKGKYDAVLICDIDISGCYGEGQRNQQFFIGRPKEFGQELDKFGANKFTTLRERLTELGVEIEVLINKNRKDWENPDNWGELIPGGWFFRINTSEKLKYGQDVFASWFTPAGKDLEIMAKFIRKNENANDSEIIDKFETVDFDEEYGSLKIFENEIINGVITHDGLQWLLSIASDRQRNEILDKCVVLSGAYYPKSQKIEVTDWTQAVDKLDEVYTNWKGNRTDKIVNGATVNTDDACFAWVGLNLGELIVDDLLIERKKAIATHGKKSPLDLLFKLCINTLYGDMVSKYFLISNPIVGNNITARARMLAWYMEKGFNGWQSITDGCGFLLNEVLKAGRDKLDGELTISKRAEKLKNRNISKTPLADVEEFLMSEHGEIFIRRNGELQSLGNGADNRFINQKAWEHLQEQFPCVDILHSETTAIKVDKETKKACYTPRVGQFSFETKNVYYSGGFHGSANYIFSKPVILISGMNAENNEGKQLSDELKQSYPNLEIILKTNDNSLNWEITQYSYIKMRGYELGRTHLGYTLLTDTDDADINDFIESERYGDSNNPARDFMNQLLENPKKIRRQDTAIKEGIVKVSEYQERASSFRKMGLVPGDTVKKAFLMSEFSLTQFTFKTWEQFVSWNKACNSTKDKYSQSIESFFLNTDGSLNFEKMVDWVYEQIQNDVIDPFVILDPNRNRVRASKKGKENNGNGKTKNTIQIEHTHHFETIRIKEILKGE